MIVGVPNHQNLTDTAIGWMNLAWDIAINEAAEFQESEFLYKEIEQEHGPKVADELIAKHWRAKQLLLNNAFSLLQQSLEIALKSRIAEVSPYLLIAGDPRSWPKPKDGSYEVDFSNFRTIDAVQLCGAVNLISADILPRGFVEFYDRMRQTRNKITHLDGSAIKVEIESLSDILAAQRYLFPDVPWTRFRCDYIRATEMYDDRDNLFGGDDYTTDVMIKEANAALAILNSHRLKTFFFFDNSKTRYRCPNCLHARNRTDDECEFVQVSAQSVMQCIICASSFTVEEYKAAIIDYFGYLDPEERKSIRQEMKEIP